MFGVPESFSSRLLSLSTILPGILWPPKMKSCARTWVHGVKVTHCWKELLIKFLENRSNSSHIGQWILHHCKTVFTFHLTKAMYFSFCVKNLFLERWCLQCDSCISSNWELKSTLKTFFFGLFPRINPTECCK